MQGFFIFFGFLYPADGFGGFFAKKA